MSPNACVRTAVCTCMVSGYSAHTSGAQVEERGGRRTPRNGGRQKSQGVSGRLGAKFGSKTTRSSPVASSSYIRARADVRPSSKHRETGTGIRRHKMSVYTLVPRSAPNVCPQALCLRMPASARPSACAWSPSTAPTPSVRRWKAPNTEERRI